MNDTHRTDQQNGPIETILRAAFPTLFDLGKIGEKTPEVRDALNTQTTLPNSVASRESVVTRGRRILTLTCEHDASRIDVATVNGREFVPGIAEVLRALHAERTDGEAPVGWREWYTEALEDVADRLALPIDSGKSGERAAIRENGGTGSPDVRNDAVRAEIPGAAEMASAMYGDAEADAVAGSIRDVIAQGALSRVSERVEASLNQLGDACRDSIRIAKLERERDTARDLAVLFRDELRTQTDLVDRLTDAVEREANDIGGEGSMTVLRLLGPNLASAKAALATEGLVVATARGMDVAGTDGPTVVDVEAREHAHYAAVGALKEDGEDEPGPSPEEQRQAFQEIADQPRPSAVEIKRVLGILDRLAHDRPSLRFVLDDDFASVGEISTMIDSLGIHCLALEIERDGLAAQLDRIADQAKPIDGTDLAELVQTAQRTAENMAGSDLVNIRASARIVDRLIAAVNDQARRLREAEETKPIHICGCDGQSANPDDLIAESYRVVSELIRHNTDPGASKWSNLVSRMRWAMIQEQRALTEARGLIDESRPVVQWVHDIASMCEIDIDLGDLGAIVATARGTFQDPPRQVRHYGADQLNDAMRALHARWSPAQLSAAPIREIVELVAQYLGLVRAQ